jgi:hyaluronate lyase
LENSPQAQAVKEDKLHVIGINFWNDAPKSIAVNGRKKFVTCNKKASVLIRQTATEICVSLSDPTQNNAGAIDIEIDQIASEKLVADKEITVHSLSPTIKLSVHTALSYGKSFTAKFSISGKKQKIVQSNKRGIR